MSGVDSVGPDGQPRFCGEPYVPVTEPTVVEESRDALAATLREVLTILGPGDGLVVGPLLVPVATYARWRAVLDEHGGIRPDVAPHDDPIGDALREASR